MIAYLCPPKEEHHAPPVSLSSHQTKSHLSPSLSLRQVHRVYDAILPKSEGTHSSFGRDTSGIDEVLREVIGYLFNVLSSCVTVPILV